MLQVHPQTDLARRRGARMCSRPASEYTPPLAPERVESRLDRIARLLAAPAMARLARAQVAVVGVGAVGYFTAEALVRSGVGRVTTAGSGAG